MEDANPEYDLVVVGGGPAGEKGAVQAAYFGKRVCIVEQAPEPGGAAVHTGTLPSKTLRETAIFLSGHKQRELYGLSVELNPELAVPRLLSRKNAVRELEVARIKWNLERHNVSLLHGAARFVDRNTIELTGPGEMPRRVTGKVFLIATGSKPYRPTHIPFDDADVDDSDSILQIDRLPKTMAVVGGGVIGCEYASMFAALGVQITLIEARDRLLSFLDNEIAERLRTAMMALGMDIRLNAPIANVHRDDARGGIVCSFNDASDLVTEKVLASSGRSGQTDGLRLESIGVELDKRGYIQVDEDYQTKVPGVYASGDVIGFPMLASTSMEQSRVAVCHAFGFDYKRHVSELLPFGIYTIPEVGCVGLSEEQAREKKIPFVVGRAFYRDNARGKILGDRDGTIKLIFARGTRKLIGCHCIGDRASELVHLGQNSMLLGGTVDTYIDMVFNYPTLSEMFKYAAYDALAKFAKAEEANA